jgi:arginine exporter protein ArgO
MLLILLKGIAAGFTLAAPGEAIGFLEIKETERSITAGIVTGFAAAGADLLYGIVTILLFQVGGALLISNQNFLTIMSGLFLCCFGAKRFFDTPTLHKVKPIHGNLFNIFSGTFMFTLTNSSTILEFIALFMGFDIEFTGYHELLIFVIGVFLGSLLWWILLSIADELFKKRMSLKILNYLNYISAIVIFSFGLYTLYQYQDSIFIQILSYP